MLLQYQSGHSTLSLKFLHFWVFITFLIWLAAKCTFFFIRKWLHHLVLHGLITQENLSMSRFQCQWDKQQDRKIKIETILLVVLMEPGSLFWLCFQGSLVHSSQFRVRSRGVAVRRGYTTSRCSYKKHSWQIKSPCSPSFKKILRAATIWVKFGGENGLKDKKHVRGGRRKITRTVTKHILFNYVAKE